MSDLCYMCAAQAVSREHVPPRALFPESKDLGEDYRRDLITVPSCDLHNSVKSRDDEFLMVSLAGIVGNNSIGYRHKFTKVNRAVRRSANRLLEVAVGKQATVHRVQIENNRFLEVIWGTPDIVRLATCFERIAYGLHCSHFGRRFEGRVKVLIGYLRHEPGNARSFAQFIRDRSELDLVDRPKLGLNQQVFYYQVSDYDNYGLFMMKLCFYGGLNVYTAFLPSASEAPANVASTFIEQGIHTVLTLGDRKYEFNRPEDG